MSIRQAILDDTAGISALFTAQIDKWQRMDARGQVQDLPYSDLTIYERWLHGGAWMSIETGSIWLSHLAGGAGLAFVYEDDGIMGYAEAFISQEAEPYGYHLHVGKIVADDKAIREALMEHLIVQAGSIGRITAASTVYDEKKLKFYRSFGLTELIQIQRVNLSSQGATAGFYKVTEHENASAEQIRDWQMPVGRVESARLHREELWSQLWLAIPSIKARKTHRLRFNAGGQDAFVVIQEHLYNPRNAEVFCWTPKALSSHLINAIRDWSYKTGYRSLTMAVHEKIAKIMDTDLETTAHQHVILVKET